LFESFTHAHRFAICRFAPRVRGATNFFPASDLVHQQVLRPPGKEDARCVQPTSATQSNCVHPHLVCSQILMPLSQQGRPTKTKASCSMSGEPDVSRHPRALRRIATQRGISCSSPHGLESRRGRVVPTALRATEPLTSVSRLRSYPHASLTFASAATLPHVLLFAGLMRVGGFRNRRGHRLRRLVKADVSDDRDAFRRQGLFIGFGGHYSPDPATASPRVMVRPLDDDLSPP